MMMDGGCDSGGDNDLLMGVVVGGVWWCWCCRWCKWC